MTRTITAGRPQAGRSSSLTHRPQVINRDRIAKGLLDCSNYNGVVLDGKLVGASNAGRNIRHWRRRPEDQVLCFRLPAGQECNDIACVDVRVHVLRAFWIVSTVDQVVKAIVHVDDVEGSSKIQVPIIACAEQPFHCSVCVESLNSMQ